MSSMYICDGCGKKEKAIFYPHGDFLRWHKPEAWFQRADKDGPQDACSRSCADKIAEKSKKTRVVLPV